MPEPNPAPNQMSFLDILELTKTYLREVLRKFWLVMIFMALLGGFLFQRKLKDPIIYTGTMTFMLNEKADMSKSMLEGLLSSDILSSMGGGGKKGEYSSGNVNLQKMEELIHSRNILQQVFFTKKTMTLQWGAPREDFIINHYLHALWYGGAREGAYFTHDSLEQFDRNEMALVLAVHRHIVLFQLKRYASPADIMTISFECPSEEISYHFVYTLFDVLSRYYMDISLEKQREIFRAAKFRVDSLEREMNKAAASYYTYLNKHNLFTQSDVMVTQQKLQRRLAAETETYLMSFKNQEMAAISLEQQEKFPLLRALDPPVFPLPATHPKPLLHLAIGLAAGMVLGIIFVVARKFLRDLIQKEKRAINP